MLTSLWMQWYCIMNCSKSDGRIRMLPFWLQSALTCEMRLLKQDSESCLVSLINIILRFLITSNHHMLDHFEYDSIWMRFRFFGDKTTKKVILNCWLSIITWGTKFIQYFTGGCFIGKLTAQCSYVIREKRMIALDQASGSFTIRSCDDEDDRMQCLWKKIITCYFSQVLI